MRIKVDGDLNIEIDHFPNDCPYCHKSVSPTFMYGHSAADHIEVVLVCTNRECHRSFIALYEELASNYWELNSTNIGTFQKRAFSSDINFISKGFEKIYNEAYFAEQNNLFEICGVGFRKALEFLIKDYAILKHPIKAREIEKVLLAKCIGDFVTDEKIKSVAKRAVWLGNDETHYIRKWEGKDLGDLKKLIDLTIHWIEAERLTESILSDMPES